LVEPTPVRDLAEKHGSRILEPVSINAAETIEELESLDADLLVVCDYGQILSARCLASARLGGVNLHGSLLPRYRGAAPIAWAIYNGETETGVTVIHMTPEVDAGPCIAQVTEPIDPEDTCQTLESRLAEIGGWALRRAVDSVEKGNLQALPQDPKLASKAPRLKKTDGLIDWTRPAAAIKNHVRAMIPWPKTYTFWRRGDGKHVRLIVTQTDVVDAPRPEAEAGFVVVAEGDELIVAAGEDAVRVRQIQPAGKKEMGAREFLRGYPVRPGERFEAEIREEPE
jgi:methionyl-tRNA formyltransferase